MATRPPRRKRYMLDSSPESLSFIVDQGELSTNVLTLRNSADVCLAFKVKSTASARYYVQPPTGRVPARSQVQVKVVLNHETTSRQADGARLHDKFLLQWAAMPDDPAVDPSATLRALKLDGGLDISERMLDAQVEVRASKSRATLRGWMRVAAEETGAGHAAPAWERRWLVLRGHKLAQYESDAAEKAGAAARLEMSLQRCAAAKCEVAGCAEGGDAHCFRVRLQAPGGAGEGEGEGGGACLLLAAVDDLSMRAWLSAVVAASELPGVIELYVTRRSNSCSAPYMLLRESGVPFKLVEVEPALGETSNAAFRALSPQGSIPLFRDIDGQCYSDLIDMLKSICVNYDSARRYYADADRGRCDVALAWRRDNVEVFRKVVYPVLGLDQGPRDKSEKDASRRSRKDEASRQRLEVGLAALAKLLSSDSRPFAAGDSVSIADFAIVPLLRLLPFAHEVSVPEELQHYQRRVQERVGVWDRMLQCKLGAVGEELDCRAFGADALPAPALVTNPQQLEFALECAMLGNAKLVAELVVQNPHGRPVAIKVKSNAPQRYFVQPPIAKIEALSTLRVRVQLRNEADIAKGAADANDRFLVVATFVPLEDLACDLAALLKQRVAEKPSAKFLAPIREKILDCTVTIVPPEPAAVATAVVELAAEAEPAAAAAAVVPALPAKEATTGCFCWKRHAVAEAVALP